MFHMELRKLNHISHEHALVKVDTRDVYPTYQARWHCDTCGKIFDGMKDGSISREDSEEADNRHAYHCHHCNFDVCSQCFRGHLHPYHNHRLKAASATLLYTGGRWECDGCKRLFSELTETMCYSCQKCEVDLCKRCFNGEWHHILHTGMGRGHSLKPINPEIKYHYYYNWSCDNCQRVFSDGHTPPVLYHCSTCQYDLCPECFTGKKHHLHPHNLIEVTSSKLRQFNCSKCRIRITEPRCHACRDSLCNFVLCNSCYFSKPKPHPYHPEHPLEQCDAGEVYPQSGGLWHCDHCTSSSPSRQPVPLSPTEKMYHCEKCQYDLCESCYLRGLEVRTKPKLTSPMQTHDEETPSYQPYKFAYYSTKPPSVSQHHSFTGMQSFSYLHNPKAPPEKVCLICNRYPATQTFVHRGQPHYERNSKISCHKCASDVLNYKRKCPLCGEVPDGTMDSDLVELQ